MVLGDGEDLAFLGVELHLPFCFPLKLGTMMHIPYLDQFYLSSDICVYMVTHEWLQYLQIPTRS